MLEESDKRAPRGAGPRVMPHENTACKFLLAGTEESRKGHMVDALALGGEEGRDKLRKAACRRK